MRVLTVTNLYPFQFDFSRFINLFIASYICWTVLPNPYLFHAPFLEDFRHSLAMHHHHPGTFVRFGLLSIYAICSSDLSAIGHQYFPLRTNQEPTNNNFISQQTSTSRQPQADDLNFYVSIKESTHLYKQVKLVPFSQGVSCFG